MATQVQWRRGTTAQISTFTGAVGEIVVDTTLNRVVVNDGATAGGWPSARSAILDGPQTNAQGAVNEKYISGIASAATIDLGAQAGNYIQITGTTTITSFGSSGQAGEMREVVFSGALLLTTSSNLILLNGSNILTAAGDVARFRYEGSGVWRLMDYSFYSGQPFVSTAAAVPGPQGRLTLSTGVPVMITNVSAATAVYYAPYVGAFVPIYNGATMQVSSFSQLTLNLDSNSGHTGYQQSGKIFDLFVFLNSGVVTLGTGPAWSSLTVRGSGAGTTQIVQQNGIWTNAVSIALKIDATATTISVPANQATYVGSIYATANGQTSFAPQSASSSPGTQAVMAVYNAYNRVRTAAIVQDSTESWSYTTAAWRHVNNAAGNSITYLDGLAQSCAHASYAVDVQMGLSTQSTAAATGVAINSITPTQGFGSVATPYEGSPNVYNQNPLAIGDFSPILGYNTINACEYVSTNTTCQFNNNALIPTARLAQLSALVDM